MMVISGQQGLKTLLVGMVVVGLSACGESPDPQSKAVITKQTSTVLNPVLVTVEGQAITQDDLSAAILRTLGEYASLQLDDSGRAKVLESLVMAKTMAISQLSTMSAVEMDDLDRTVNAYREELLTKQYLKQNLTPVPVTQAMVKAYYDKHPDRFGGKTIRSYEIVKGLVKLKSATQNQLIEQLAQFDSKTKWQQKVASLKQSGLQIQYAKGAADGKLLNADFQKAVGALLLNEVSPVYFFDGYPSIIRVTKVRTIGAKPLSEVSSDIRKTLLPVQLKQAIKQAAAGLSQSMKVDYQSGV
jgi:hypothetical protein